MSGKFLSPKATMLMLTLAGQSYRPPQIVKLREEIEAETRALELTSSTSGRIDQKRIAKIVTMRLGLDRLYVLWTEGKLDEKPQCAE